MRVRAVHPGLASDAASLLENVAKAQSRGPFWETNKYSLSDAIVK